MNNELQSIWKEVVIRKAGIGDKICLSLWPPGYAYICEAGYECCDVMF
jgi:hypothetical protein